MVSCSHTYSEGEYFSMYLIIYPYKLISYRIYYLSLNIWKVFYDVDM